MKNVELKDIVVDPSLQARRTNTQMVSEYTASMKAGAEFPPITLDKKNRIICGFHRYEAYKRTLEPESVVSCLIIDFKTDKDAFCHAASDNISHGLRLTTFDQKCIISRMFELKMSATEICNVLQIPQKKLKKLGDQFVVVVGEKGKERREPVKRMFPKHLLGTKITTNQYEEHKQRDGGANVSHMISIIRRFVENNWLTSDQHEEFAELIDFYMQNRPINA